MATSTTSEIENTLKLKAKRLFGLFSLSLLSILSSLAQPVWVPTTPSVGSLGPTTIPVNYGIDRVGTVYIAIYSYNNPLILSPATVRALGLSAPAGNLVATAAIPIAAGNINAVLQRIFNVVNANTTHTIYIVAADAGNVLQPASVRMTATTLPCPLINLLTGFTQPVICINQNPVATFEVVILNPNPLVNGILRGTQWTLDWGDGSGLVTYTSTADNDIPPLALRTHAYSNVTTCNYVFSNGIRNPCGQTRAVQYIAIVHGRDIPSDGDGILRIVDNATGSATINVCEGIQSVITLRDNSVWNCQNPTLPGGLTPVPNLDPRNIEWTYGRDPLGAITNTITGTVAIAALGNAPQASGRLSPIAAPNTLSQAITIPASCVAGQYFRVYLKNWNKCNWADPDYVNTFVNINVVAAPPAPTVVKPPICFGDNRTLTVTSPVVGTISWYAEAGLTTLLGTGVSYTPTQTAPGNHNVWVVDRANTGLLCQGPAAMVTLTINPLPNKPTITFTGNLEFCFDGITSVILQANVVTPPAVTSYQWYKDGVAVGGATASTLTLNQGGQTGNYTVIAYGANPTNCPSPVSDPVSVIIHALSNLTNPVPVTICENGTAIYTASTTDLVQNWQWERSDNGGASYSTVGLGPPYSGFNTNTLTINPAPLSLNGYLYRVEIKTPPGQGGCTFRSNPALLTVNPNAVITLTSAAGTNIQSPCINTPITNITYSVTGGGTGAGVAGLPAGVTGSFAAGTFTISGTPTATGTYNYTVTTTGTCTQATATGTLTVRPNNTITLTSAAATENQTRCINTAIANITYTTTGATGATFSGLPAGVSGSWAANAITISGTPTASGTFNYTITLTGGCGIITRSGTITVTPNNTITLTSAAATENQTRCINTAIANITYITTGATGANFSGLPAGVTGSWAANAITISGTPTASGTFNYTITLTGGCGTITRTGTINVTPNNTITRTSAVATEAQTVCINTAITNITYNTTGATGATFSGLPAGVSGSWAANAIIITGTPTASGTFNYTITLTGGCGNITRSRTITVSPNNTITLTSAAGTDNQTVCANSAITNITYSTTGATGATFANLPAGVSGSWAANNITISGTPSVTGTFNYTITLTGGCGVITRNGTITVNNPATANAGLDRSICALATVTLAGSVGGSAVSGTWTSAGTGTFAPNPTTLNAVYTPSALERTAGTATLTLTTNDPAGVCLPAIDVMVITIGSVPTAATLTGSGNACSGASSTITSVITGGAPPYTINYTRNGVAQAAITPYTSGNPFNLGVLPVGTYNYQITSVTDVCGNSVPAPGLPGVYTIRIFPIPDVSATIPALQNICSDGTASITFNSTVNNTIFNYTVASAPGAGYSWTAGKDPVNGSVTDADGNGTETITRQLQHNYSAAVTVFYTITPTGPGVTACVGTPITRSVIVNPVPVVTTVGGMTATACSGTAFTVTPVNGVNGVIPAGTTYSWAAPVVTGGLTGGAAGAGAANINGNLSNPTNTAQTATYTVTPTSGTCPGSSFLVTVTVNPRPAITNMTATTCSATAFSVTPANVTNGIVPAATTYSWPAPVVTGAMTGGAAGAGAAAIGGTITNPTTSIQTATYTVTPLSGTCSGSNFTVIVTVYPNPVLSTTLTPAAICSNTAFSYVPASATAGTTFNWSRAAVAGISNAAASGTNNPNETLINTTASAINVTYAYTLAANGCSNVQNVVVSVKPTPVLSTTLTPAAICSNTVFSYVPASATAGTTFNWSRAAVAGISNAAASGINNPNETLINTTANAINVTYVYTLAATGCSNVQNVVVSVKPTPVLSTTLTPAAICSNTVFSYAPASATAGTTFNWSRAAVAGISNAAASGTDNPNETLINTTAIAINVTYVYTLAATGCSNVQNVVVSVKPTPVLSTTLTPADICSNTVFSYAPASATAGTTFNWSRAAVAGISNAAASGTNNPNETLINTTSSSINVTYAYTLAANGCSNVQNVVVSVKPTPVLSTTLTPAAICNNTAFSYVPASATAGTTFNWSRAAVAGISNAAASGTNNPNETLVNTTANAINVTYVYTLAATGCSNVQNVVVSVKPTPVLSSTLTPAAICSNTVFSYAPASATAGTTFNWSRAAVAGISNAAASGTDNPNETLINTTAVAINVTYVYTLAATGCSNVQNVVVSVKPTPVLSTTLTPADICSNTVFSYAPVSLTAGTTFNWTRAAVGGITPAGPASGINNPNETLRNQTSAPIAVTYQYTLTSNGCSNVQNVVVNINPEPVITAGQITAACSGNALSYQILLNNFINPGANVIFTWPAPVLNPINVNFTGGTARGSASSANITDTYTNTMGALGTATYTVTPFLNGCAGAPVNIVVNVGSEPVLDPGLNSFACSNVPIGLILKEAAGSVVPTYYNVISKTVAGGLTDAGNVPVPNGTAAADYLSTDRYTNTTGVNLTVTYRVQPILAPNCIGDAVDVVITIRPQPIIFPAQTRTVCSGVAIGKEIVLVPANTPAGTIFNWPVPVLSDASVQGTAGINVAADPALKIHINDAINNYSGSPITATYTITPVSSFGCAGTPTTAIFTINPEPIPQPISGRDKICVTDKNVVYNVTAVPGSTFHWTVPAAVGTKTFDFNTNAILIDAAAVAGSGNITVYETNSYVCDGDPSSLTVQVYSVPAPENIIGPATVCANSTQVYSVTNRVGSTYSWTIPGGSAIVGDPSASSITLIFANVGGTILVRETNAAGCITNHNPFAVSVNPLPTATISGGGTICDGASRNLSVDFTGTGPYSFTYALNGVPQPPVATAADPYTLNVILAGAYTIVNVTDANCTNIGTGTTTVSYFPKPTGTISGTTEMCRGASTTLTMTFTGVAPYTFTYTDGTTPVTVAGHLTNVYTVSVSPLVNTTYTLTSLTDGNTCTGVLSGSAVITINLPPVLTLSGTNLICYNVSTGAVNMTITDGTAPFGISWTGPDSFTAFTEDISALKAGYYAVSVLDTKGCTATANITLTQPPVLSGSAAGTNITCFGASDGTITISGAAGGAGTHEFTINGGGAWQASPNFTGLAPGTYNVIMRDALNTSCMLTLNAALLITQPAVLNATVVKTDVNCFAANNGSIVISAPSGGYGTYGYSIDGGATWQGSGNFTNLAPGTYNVSIRDAVQTACQRALGAFIITQPAVLSATVSSTNITCFGSTDGTITISAPAGGHGTYEYSINGGGSWQGSGSFPNLSPGTYNVQIRDAAYTGCYIILNNALVITQPAVLSALVASTNITCNGANDGIINITAPTGGYGTYEYSINGGAGWQGAGLFNALAPGTYDVRIRDAANQLCVIILNAGLQITQPAALTGLVIDTDVTCFGANDGIINITNSAGGYGTYQYSINGGGAWQDSPAFPGLTPATYDVRIRDRAHIACVITLDAAVVITQPAILNAAVAYTNVTCFGAGDGTITISSPTGGYGSYGYSINGGTSWQGSGTFTNLLPGTYNIRIRDAAHTGCIIALNPAVLITEPVALSATLLKTNVTCFGAANGTIIINGAAGGYGTYEYTVNGGATWQASNSFPGLTPGFYNVRIRDAANPACIITINGSVNVTEPPILNANVARTNVTCNGAANGTITISSPSGGYGTYQYSINGGGAWQASGSFSGLAPGNYNVQIRDAAQTACVIILNPALAITEPAILAATVTPTNVSCFGANNGIISITGAAGGYGTYEYSINGGTNWSGLGNFTNLIPGTYDVRIRDAANTACVITLNGALQITQPAVLSAAVARTNITCFGAGDGTITISSPAGGYGTYEYSINGGGSWQGSGIFTALGPGNYNVQIRDAAHTPCVIVLNNALQITQPAILNAVITPTNVTCNGANDGIINITAPAGGYGTYQYSIDGGAGWQGAGLFNGLTPGTYDVRIRDAVNTACVVVLNNGLTITEPAVLSANVNSTNVTCFGANNGTITIMNPTGGYGTYDYSNNGGTSWQATGTFTSLVPGSYNVQIRDRAHIACVIILNPALLITQPAVLSGTVASTNVTCFGANNGTITVTNPLGGYGTFQYSVNGGTTWQSSGIFSSLAPATYDVRIRDAAWPACEITLNAALVITQPAVLSGTVASTNVTCNGANDGIITISSPSGGYGTYEYTINGGAAWQASGSFTALTPGFYNVQIRDAANTGCVITLNSSLRITEPNVLSANVVSTNVTCNGAGDGTITISSPSGGYGTYQYSINGGGAWQASGSFSALAPAAYNVQIRDAAHTGCVIVLNAALVITQPAVLNATVTPTNVTCFGANDGIISITAPTGGYGSYQYTINGGTTWSGSGNFTNLVPATYNIQIRDAVNQACVVILNAALIITQPVVLSATVAKTDVTCFGGGDGTITISSPAGGYGTYEYSINGGGSWQASGIFTALGPGSYNVRIRDAAHTGCVIVLNSSLAITQPAVLNATVTPTNVTCNGANDGVINITSPTGGYGTYQYSINGGAGWQGTGLFNGLTPGTYDVRIRDAANTACEITLNSSLTITEPAVLSATVTSFNITCFGANNGSISVTSPSGGYGTYDYSRDGGATWQATGTFTNLIPGSYNVQIRDRAHPACVIILNPALVITQPAVLSGTVASTNVTCFGANNGTITITNPLGGYGTYQYSINGGTTWQGSGSFTGLAPATYNVRIRDAANIACEIVLNAAVAITQPAVLSATVASTNVTCFGAADGTITITNPLGGYGTYGYSVNGGATWQASGNFTALTPGFYNVQIRDAANPGCVIILNGSLRITEPSVLAAIVSSTNVTCNGSSDGTITIFGASGGYGTYEYSINGGGTWQASGSFSALPPATYNVQIRDAANTACVIVLNAALVITQPAVLSATVTPTMVSCFNANNGIITITSPAGGYGTYQFSINGGTTWQGSGTFSNLAPGSYNVRIRDAANTACVIILNPALTITQPVILSAALASTNVTCFGGNDGTITISGAAGGYGTYEYSINGGGSWQASGSFTGLTTGSYNILIRDAAHIGCVIVLNSAYSITQPGLLSATVSKTDVTCNGADDGTISITAPTGGYGTFEYSVNGGASWQVSGSYSGLIPGTYDVRIRDAANTACSVILYPNLVITEPILLAMTSTGDIALNCFGDNSGIGTFYVSGGTMPYTFTVVTNTAGATISFPGFNSQTFFGAGAGTVTVSVTDQNGCFAQGTIIITQPALLTPGTIAASQVICSGTNPAQLTQTVAATGGPAAYVYQWQYGSTAAGPFINIAGANASQYTPAAGATTTLFYRRMVTSGMCAPVYSNVIEIRVNPNPLAILSGGETICPAQTSILRVNMMIGTGPFELDIENYGTITGYVSNTDIVVSPAATTTYRLLRVRDANNCEILSPSANLIGTATVTVRALPAITVQPVSRISCEFGIVTYSVTATGTDLTYQWYVNEGSGFNPVADGGIYFGATASTLNLFGVTRLMNNYVYHAVVSGCSATVTSADATLTVNTPPEIVTQPADSTICMNAGATFSVTATGTNLTYQWQVNRGAGFVNVVNDANFSGATLNTLTVTNAPGTFNNNIFRAIISGTCGVPVYSNFAVLRVNNPPVVTLNPVNRSVCDGIGPVLFTANGSGMIDSLRWQVFSGGAWSDVFDNVVYSGSTSQQLTLSNAPFGFNGNQYRLSIKAKCTTVYTNSATLTVYANPVVDFSAVDPIRACGGVPLVINGNPSGGSGIWASHLWTGDVGPLNNYYIQSPTFNSQIAGTYLLTYQVRDSRGCFGSDDVSVVVDAPDASFTWDINSGCTPATISFSKDMTGIARFWWDFDDGSPIDSVNANPVHQFINVSATAIEYRNVELRVQSPGGCFDTFTGMITIYPAIDASFTASPDTVCSGNSISFTALTGASKYFWEYGDGVSGYSSNNASHLYTNVTTVPVVRTVTLTTTSFYNCTDIKTFDIVVMPVPMPQFTANPATQIFNAAGNPVVFTNTTNPGTWNWLWTFGDGATSVVQDPTHTYTNVGTFRVTLRASNATCSESVTHDVIVNEIPPVADFDSLPSGCEPLSLVINNTSLNTEIPGTTYKWDFGDGSTSTAKNPTYTYFDAGIYRVELTVTGPGGTSVKSQVVSSYASPKAYFEITPAKVIVNDEQVRCFNLSEGASYYLWDFGDGDTSKVYEPYHKYMEEGLYDITLWAYSANGCSDKYLLSPGVTVEPAGVIRFPTVFTPNKDGEIEIDERPTGGPEYDMFFFPPIMDQVSKYKLQVFNRWGVLIFETDDFNKPWNGYYQHKLCPQGVYVWYVEGKYANGEPFKMVGDVTLLH